MLGLDTHGTLSSPTPTPYLDDPIKSHGIKHYLLMTPKFILLTQTTNKTTDSYTHISTSLSTKPFKTQFV